MWQVFRREGLEGEAGFKKRGAVCLAAEGRIEFPRRGVGVSR
ncbi:hypothetical protein [Bacillus cereus group sp. BfR-BA-01430]|nr:hypothetical protein [Bacillus cereus group sp. BfR-BA-01430]